MSLSRKKKSWNADGIEVLNVGGEQSAGIFPVFLPLTGIHQSVIRVGSRTVYCTKQPLGHGF
jgi:hypothetical protein